MSIDWRAVRDVLASGGLSLIATPVKHERPIDPSPRRCGCGCGRRLGERAMWTVPRVPPTPPLMYGG